MTDASAARDAVMQWLRDARFDPRPVIDVDEKPVVLDLSTGSEALGAPVETLDVATLGERIEELMRRAGTGFAFGRWGESRGLYQSEHFAGDGDERRTVHLGVDLFCRPGTAVHAPLDATVEVVADNARELDYGPMIVLRHTTPDEQPYYTLYGHLGPDCLAELGVGQRITAGERIATVGAPPRNGNWPPHLHFQLVLDLLDMGREFPGVAFASQQDRWLGLSPNPACFFPKVSAAALDGRSATQQ